MKNKELQAPKGSKFYFAYGSNMNIEQMRYRCPRAQKMFPVTIKGYRLTFRGRQRDGWGVATIIPDEKEQVQGILWAIDKYSEFALDAYEGFPHLYTKENVTVETPGGDSINAMVYIMNTTYEPAYPGIPYIIGILEGYNANRISPKPLYEAIACVKKEIAAKNRERTRLKIVQEGRAANE